MFVYNTRVPMDMSNVPSCNTYYNQTYLFEQIFNEFKSARSMLPCFTLYIDHPRDGIPIVHCYLDYRLTRLVPISSAPNEALYTAEFSLKKLKLKR